MLWAQPTILSSRFASRFFWKPSENMFHFQSDDDQSILLVDDDPETLELLEETLRSAGYETQSVRSGHGPWKCCLLNS